MRLSFAARCIPSGSTFTSRLAQLAQRVEQLVAAGAGSNTTTTIRNGIGDDTGEVCGVNSLWEEVMAAAKSARALKETDTMLAVVFRLLRCGYQPPNVSTWVALIRDLTPHSDIEANSVLAYPGISEDAAEYHNTRTSFPGFHDTLSTDSAAVAVEDDDTSENLFPPVRVTRETLLLTGGVVPLSARVPCSDGGALGHLLVSFCAVCEAHLGSCTDAVDHACLQDVETAVMSALQHMAPTVLVTESSPLTLALLRFLRFLLLILTHHSSLNKAQKQQLGKPLLESFSEKLTKVLSTNALGARVVLLFLVEHHTEFPEDMVHLPLVRTAVCGVWRNYEAREEFSCLQQLQQVNNLVDVTLQRNANNGNPLGLQESDEMDLRLQLSTALLRAMRVEATSPDAFLRDAVDIVDRCPVYLSIEYELIVAKVRLLDLFLGDEESCSTIYDDLLQSLRALVELRPQDRDMNAPDTFGFSTMKLRPEEEDMRLQRSRFQEAHRLVIAAFARSHLDERLNQAYTIIVTHKYHGLSITKEVTHPLLDVLSRRGDCRVFNIVDLCVLYSGNSIDYETLTCLFRACRVAGDFYRARTLYQLLREMIPGFLLRAPEAIRDMLWELKVLEPEPAHLFSASLAQVDGDVTAVEAAVFEGFVGDEMPNDRRRGPIRELPSAKVETPRKKTTVRSTG